MFGAQTRVPVDLGEVECEFDALFLVHDVHVTVASEDFVGKGAEFALGADVVDFVDDGLGVALLVLYDFADDVSVRKMVIAKVEMRYALSTVVFVSEQRV